jgi:hypothetical protein
MNCHNCGKEIGLYHFLALKKYEFPIGLSSDKHYDESHEFCSEECMKAFKLPSKDGLSDKYFWDPLDVFRCRGYYGCERLNNLRGRCEKYETHKIKEDEPIESQAPRNLSHFSNIPAAIFIPPVPFCEPSEVAIISANLKLFDLFDRFDKESTKLNKEMLIHTKSMSRLTKWILVLTILNTIFVILQIVLSISR